jgi:energy-coupling factor transporter ATP-binding protein EcfA2
MRLSSIELRNYRCFDHLEVELDETTVIVGANDTGKSTLLEAIHGLLDRYQIDWDEVAREPKLPVQIIGRFVDLPVEESESLDPFISDGRLAIGLTSDSEGRDPWLIVTPSQADRISELLDQESRNEALAAGTVPPGFEHGLTRKGPNGAEVWYWWWIWEFGSEGSWRILDDWLEATMRPIRLGTSAETGWDPLAVLEPILRRHLEGDLDPELAEALELAEDRYFDLLTRVSRAHSRVLATTSPYRWIRWHGIIGRSDIEGNLVGSLSADPNGPPEIRKADGLPSLRDRRYQAMLSILRARTTTLSDLGPGTQRSVALAALKLYQDPDLWPLGGSAALLVEEPESGLHPAAQRDAASLLAGLATHGLQVIVVTHSPTFINAVPPTGIRLARRVTDDDGESSRTVVRPAGLLDVREALGIHPADILLARRFAIVEGRSDCLVLDAWARRLAVDLRTAQVQLVPSNGYSSAARVSQFMALAYEGAEFVVILDEGAKALETRLEIEAMGRSDVSVVVLSKTKIEGFFRPGPVAGWLRVNGALDEDLDNFVSVALDQEKGGRVSALHRLTHKYLGRAYDKVTDGLAIASLTPESEVSPEIVELVMRLSR